MNATGGFLLLAVLEWWVCAAGAANVTGQWRAEFENPRGTQKYLFTFR
jgi:hypothetical protein